MLVFLDSRLRGNDGKTELVDGLVGNRAFAHALALFGIMGNLLGLF